jgi:hypothetical protein
MGPHWSATLPRLARQAVDVFLGPRKATIGTADELVPLPKGLRFLGILETCKLRVRQSIDD